MYPASVTNFLHTAMLMLQIGLQKKLPQKGQLLSQGGLTRPLFTVDFRRVIFHRHVQDFWRL